MTAILRPAIVLFLVLTALTGIVYPLAVTAIAQVIFRDQVQTAIHHLIRGYEATTGRSVTRLDYDPREGRITLEALPL